MQQQGGRAHPAPRPDRARRAARHRARVGAQSRRAAGSGQVGFIGGRACRRGSRRLSCNFKLT
ncbi:hypothetical protein C6Q22_04345 [Burkholderia multivorans]|nr:hypothetical protein C6P79_01100 [Burkholderia multivorans]PRF93514.1 hypothetical protein C6Q22_04345 [Burkholderia multivorans]PRG66006.1 hypothetical protein C6T69_21095 [Burkholderia multivorans]RSB77385.1 hypothetical protein EGT33_08890 [Burkholderia multivorans]